MARMTKADLVELLAANKLSMMRSGYVPESFFDNAVCAPVSPDPGFTLEHAVAYVKNSYKTRDELWMAATRVRVERLASMDSEIAEARAALAKLEAERAAYVAEAESYALEG